MITLLYNQTDYEAANIAMKVQSLSQNQPSKIYIVPKHYGRNNGDVFQKLNKTKVAIFIAVERKAPDQNTYNELMHLKERKIPIKYIVPQRYSLDIFKPKAGDVYLYRPNTTRNNLVHNVSNAIADLNKQIEEGKRDNALAAVILSALLLIGLAASSSSSSK